MTETTFQRKDSVVGYFNEYEKSRKSKLRIHIKRCSDGSELWFNSEDELFYEKWPNCIETHYDYKGNIVRRKLKDRCEYYDSNGRVYHVKFSDGHEAWY
jgi:hypothetical protein